MNHLSDWDQRVNSTKDLLKQETEWLLAGMNPITKAQPTVARIDYEVHPQTGLVKALYQVLDKLKIEPKTRQDIAGMLTHVANGAVALSMNNLAVKDVRRKHIKSLLEQIGSTKPRWSANTFNHYRKYLSVLFRELVELEACEFNPEQAISKQKVIRKIREIATQQQRKLISDHLEKHYHRFWLFMQVFFHSGARTTELLKVQAKDVNLETQYVKITIIKGKARREVKKVIKDVALHYWQEAIGEAKPDDYIFSTDLKPGPSPIRAEQISRRWRMHVKAAPGKPDAKHKTKGSLGIDIDFYSLKHLHSDQVAAELGLQAAGQLGCHTSTSTTMIYAVNERERQAEKIKKLGNKFA